MEWAQVLTIIAANCGMFLWARRESRRDYLHMEKRTDTLLNAIHQEMKSFHQEIKDFHGRLCTIEERRK